MKARSLLAALPATVLAGCFVAVPLDDKRCDDGHPCVDGYACVEGTCVADDVPAGELLGPCFPNGTCNDHLVCHAGRCVEDDGDEDAGPTTTDAGRDDAGRPPPDAGPIDAGDPSDGGSDAGVDAGAPDGGAPLDDGGPGDAGVGDAAGDDAGVEDGGAPVDGGAPDAGVEAGPVCLPRDELFSYWPLDFPTGAPLSASEDPSIVGLWHLDGDATDASGNGHHGASEAGSDIETGFGRFGSGVRFAGVDEIAIDDAAALRPQTLTFAIWARATTTSERAIAEGAGGQSGYGWHLSRVNELVEAELVDVTGAVHTLSQPAPGGGTEWTHVALVVEPGVEAALYVNGVSVDSVPWPAGGLRYNPSDAPMQIGDCNEVTEWTGDLDEAVLYSRALAPDEVRALYQRAALLDAVGDRHGESFGAENVPGAHDEALAFDGTADLAYVLNALSLVAGDATLLGRFRLDEAFTPGSAESRLLTGGWLGDERNWHVLLHGSSLDDDANVPAGALVVKLEATAAPARLWSETTSWQAGRWYSFAVVWDPDTPSERHLYVDGVLDEGGAQPGLAALSASGGQLILGQGLRENADGELVTTGFAGALDDLMIYRRKLTPSEIAAYAGVADLCAP